MQYIIHARHAKRTLESANHGINGLWRQVLVATFTIGAELEHGSVLGLTVSRQIVAGAVDLEHPPDEMLSYLQRATGRMPRAMQAIKSEHRKTPSLKPSGMQHSRRAVSRGAIRVWGPAPPMRLRVASLGN